MSKSENDAIAYVLREAIKRMTVPPLWPGGPGGTGATEYDLSRAIGAWFEEALLSEWDRRATTEPEYDRDIWKAAAADLRALLWQSTPPGSTGVTA